MPGVVSESYTAPQLDIVTPTYDDIVAFGHVLHEAAEYNADQLLGYFEKPHKWQREFAYWKRLGGTLDHQTIATMESWFQSESDADKEFASYR